MASQKVSVDFTWIDLYLSEELMWWESSQMSSSITDGQITESAQTLALRHWWPTIQSAITGWKQQATGLKYSCLCLCACPCRMPCPEGWIKDRLILLATSNPSLQPELCGHPHSSITPRGTTKHSKHTAQRTQRVLHTSHFFVKPSGL